MVELERKLMSTPMTENKQKIGSVIARVPREEQAAQVKENKSPAAGRGALWSSLKELRTHTGLIEGAKLLAKVNQEGGFDCPGCAWPDPPSGERSAFEFCENGVKAVAAEGTRRRVTASFFSEHSISSLRSQSDYWLESQGRLTQPMFKPIDQDHYQAISWSEAFEKLGSKLSVLKDPNQAVFYTSGRTSNEAAFLYQLYARMLGTNNLPDCSNMCHESSGRGLGETIGTGKGTVQLSDFEHADCIMVIGQNPGTNHPRMLTSLESAAQRGCKIIAINPLRERGLERFSHPQKPLALLGRSTAISTHYVQVQINGDVALLKGIMKTLLELDESEPGQWIDHDFIAQHTSGYTEFVQALESVTWSDIVTRSGIDEETIREIADVYGRSKASIACWAMGLTQHENGVENIREVVNLLLLKGNIGRLGAGACPVRGHSNVQGDRTVGIVERPGEALLSALDHHFDFTAPREHGYDVVNTIHAMNQGDVNVFMAMGGNFLSATPDTDYTAAGLSKVALSVQVSTKLNRSHLVTGKEALILPCLGRTELDVQATGEQFVTVEDSMSVVHRSQGRRRPASSNLLSEPAIICRLAQATWTTKDHKGGQLPWADYEANYAVIRKEIESVIPGFKSEEGHYEERSKDGFILPNSARERKWSVQGGDRARFTLQSIPNDARLEGQLLMMTVRSHDQYNTTIYGWDDRYRGIYGGRQVIMMNPVDIEERNLQDGEKVLIESFFGSEIRRVSGFKIVSQSIPKGCVATYFPEANPLVPARQTARISNTPASKSVVVTVSKL
jgi:molybdopterin-dependent oxidoreductase alpha subunit